MHRFVWSSHQQFRWNLYQSKIEINNTKHANEASAFVAYVFFAVYNLLNVCLSHDSNCTLYRSMFIFNFFHLLVVCCFFKWQRWWRHFPGFFPRNCDSVARIVTKCRRLFKIFFRSFCTLECLFFSWLLCLLLLFVFDSIFILLLCALN